MLASDALNILCFGVSRYRDPSLNLGFAAENAERLALAFGKSEGCGVPSSNIELLLDEEATSKAIADALAMAAHAAREEDVLIVYFSGHGEREGENFYLLSHDAD